MIGRRRRRGKQLNKMLCGVGEDVVGVWVVLSCESLV
jgi:hypothetical protein